MEHKTYTELLNSKLNNTEDTKFIVKTPGMDSNTILIYVLKNEDGYYESLPIYAEVTTDSNDVILWKGYKPNQEIKVEEISEELLLALSTVLNTEVTKENIFNLPNVRVA